MKTYIILILSMAAKLLLGQQNLLPFVNPFIGTEKMGHTYPGATVPFGMVQLSPDTDTIELFDQGKYNPDIYKYCAGYQYTDKTIVGFSHTHFSGTGHSDLGDILIMPTVGKLQLNPGIASQPESGFRSKFSHGNEIATPNYYKVMLDDDGIQAELTTSSRVGMHRYTFPQSGEAHIILDLVSGIYNYSSKNVWTFVRVENDSLVTGYRQTNGWAKTRTVYFAIAFSKPFRSYGYKNFAQKVPYNGFWGKFNQYRNFPEMAGTQIRAYFDFETETQEAVQLKVALSSVSTEGAVMNLKAEIPHWNFDQVKTEGQALWNKELNKVLVETLSANDKVNFYTALYHSFLGPTLYMDVDGKYKGLDQNIHQADGFTNYTTFSLWDTYRALHPLLNILQPKRNSDMVRSMLAHYEQSAQHMLPIWSHYANENWCMIGYHSVSVIADAVMKNIGGFDANVVLDACIATSNHRTFDGVGDYLDKGYVPEDRSGSSVSKTLEYAYDDWCIAQMATKLNRPTVAETYRKRAQNYKNVFDAASGYMRPKMSGGDFKKEFDVLSTHDQGFIEGNSWNYSLYVPHEPDTLIKMMGGKTRFAKHLDSLFTFDLPEKYFAETEDITKEGIIGNYVHGNEPSHHAPYLFNWTDQPWKAQEKLRMILPRMYRPTSDGLGGNDDCGQMSAWYVFTALGFYPVAPGSNEYVIGSPAVKSALIHLDDHRTLFIDVQNQSEKSIYLDKVSFNGKDLSMPVLTHEMLMNGGKLSFTLAAAPNKLLFRK